MSYYYAVANGRNIGIFNNWNDCNNSIKGFKNAKYKKFSTEIDAKKFISENCIDDFTPDYYVYTDGSCINNGKDNAIAGIGVFFGNDDKRNVSERLIGKHTNNSAELLAIYRAYYLIEKDIELGKKIIIVSDSTYAINCVKSYGEKCSKNNWKNDIPNKEIVYKLYNLFRDIQNVKFLHINSHTNNKDIHSIGNYNADKLAISCLYN